MPIRFTRLTVCAVTAALLAATAVQAQDRLPRRAKAVSRPSAVLLAEIKAPPLTVQKRSFLDPGNVVPVYSATPEYIAANTVENRPVYAQFAPGRFGESTLPGRFELPDNPRFFPNRDLDFSPF